MKTFEKYLSLWVLICIAAGILIGKFLPQIPEFLSRLEYAEVSLPVAVLIWLMIYPMMLKIDFKSVANAGKHPKGIIITCVSNWLIKPFSMYILSYFFFFVCFKSFISEDLAEEYLCGAVLLGAAPCTAMVFVWSYLSKGDAAYTLVQVAVNDLIILLAYAPITALLLGIGGVHIPYNTLFFSVTVFVIIPLAAGIVSRISVIRKKGKEYFETVFTNKFSEITNIGLLLTLIIIFSFQGGKILENPLHIVLIAAVLSVQTFFIFAFAYLWAKKWHLPHRIAGPAGLIGASNFFELAVAVAVSLFGLRNGASTATVVGVLTEVPLMLCLVSIVRRTKKYFKD